MSADSGKFGLSGLVPFGIHLEMFRAATAMQPFSLPTNSDLGVLAADLAFSILYFSLVIPLLFACHKKNAMCRQRDFQDKKLAVRFGIFYKFARVALITAVPARWLEILPA